MRPGDAAGPGEVESEKCRKLQPDSIDVKSSLDAISREGRVRSRLAVGRVIVYKSKGVDKTGRPFS